MGIIQNDISSMTIDNMNGSDLHFLDYEDMIREHIISAMDEWNEMKRLYNREANQRKSRISEDDLEIHRVLLLQIRGHIYEMNDEDLYGISNDLNLDTENQTAKIAASNNNCLSSIDQNNDHSDSTPLKSDGLSERELQITTPFKESHTILKKSLEPNGDTTTRISLKKNDRVKEMDEKIKKIQEKIAHLRAMADESVEIANSNAFEISGKNKKLLAMNKALSTKRVEMKEENKELMEQLEAENNELKECVNNL